MPESEARAREMSMGCRNAAWGARLCARCKGARFRRARLYRELARIHANVVDVSTHVGACGWPRSSPLQARVPPAREHCGKHAACAVSVVHAAHVVYSATSIALIGHWQLRWRPAG